MLLLGLLGELPAVEQAPTPQPAPIQTPAPADITVTVLGAVPKPGKFHAAEWGLQPAEQRNQHHCRPEQSAEYRRSSMTAPNSKDQTRANGKAERSCHQRGGRVLDHPGDNLRWGALRNIIHDSLANLPRHGGQRYKESCPNCGTSVMVALAPLHNAA
jgi:hypothetical protein